MGLRTCAALAEDLVALPDVAYAIPRTSIEQDSAPENALIRAVRNNHNPSRSGNIYVVFRSGRFINEMDGLAAAVTQGSPWRYDTYVLVIFVGYGLEARTVKRRIHTVDVALTLPNVVGAVAKRRRRERSVRRPGAQSRPVIVASSGLRIAKPRFAL